MFDELARLWLGLAARAGSCQLKALVVSGGGSRIVDPPLPCRTPATAISGHRAITYKNPIASSLATAITNPAATRCRADPATSLDSAS